MTDTAHPATASPAPVKTTLDIIDIFHILPHRFPFLLIDRVIEIQRRQRIVAIKNVTINEPFFAGHFPNLPIMPGVLIVEAIAQAGGALLLTEVEDRKNKLIMFTGIERAKFRRPVVPGDQLRIEVELKNWRARAAHDRRPHGGNCLRGRQARGRSRGQLSAGGDCPRAGRGGWRRSTANSDEPE